jgi:hypothetical protein
MRRTLERWRRQIVPGQLELDWSPQAAPPAAPAPEADPGHSVFARLRALGLRGIRHCTLTGNRTTMVSFHGDRLRVHRAFAAAPADVLQAVVHFVNGRGAVRRKARRALAAFEIPREVLAAHATRRRPASHPDDVPLVTRLAAAHAELNRERFDGALKTVAIRISRRMRSRLGHYSPGGALPPEICIGRRHFRRDGWTSVLETLAHEMVHQWQHETARPIAHDRDFRLKARAIGIAPHAKRPAD